MVFLLAAVLAVVLWVAYRALIYRKAVRYKPTTGSNYELPAGRPVEIPFTLDNEPGTLLLELKLKCSLLGRIFDPSLVASFDGQTLEFWFERGVAANRHLVLPAIPGARYEIRARHLSVNPKATAWLYPAITPESLAIIAPHPDDAEIAAFGLYRSQPEKTHILNVTQGEKGIAQRVPGMAPEVQRALTGTLRSFDARTIPLLANVPPGNLSDLAWSEAEFPLSDSRRANLAEEIQKFLAASGARRVVIPHPRLDNHAVHLDVARATIEALRRLNDPGIKLLGSLIHVPGHRAYPLGGLGSGVALPPNATRLKAFTEIQAHWLSREDQTLKCFALEANHDLRGLPPPFAEPLHLFHLARYGLRGWLSGVPDVASTDYYRRSVRACELFLVYDFASIPESTK